MEKYAYIRVSTKEQNIDRQLNKTSTVITNQVKILIVQLTKNFLES